MTSPFRVPSFFQPRRSFNRLRSFHLTPAEVNALAASARHAPGGSTKSLSIKEKLGEIGEKLAIEHPIRLPIPGNLVIPIRGATVVLLAFLSSLFFIVIVSCAFLGADAGESSFKHTLDSLGQSNPGLVLLGESVDVDVDEPSITIRWSIIGCGDDFMLPGSAGVHGSQVCGLPDTPLYIYVDSDDEPTATYDPSEIPFNKESGQRRSIQNLVQFDSDHVLDVHEARLYPFDTYFLTSTIRATTFDNVTVPIRKLLTIDITSSFDISTKDIDSYSSTVNGTQDASRDIDMDVVRPTEARLFTLLLFTVSWILTHVTIGHVLLARRLYGLRSLLPHLVSSGAILIAIPQLRSSMPDAPGFDGVLIDSIGYFPQMIIVGISTIILLLIIVVRELDAMRNPPPHPLRPASFVGYPARPTSLISQFPHPPPIPHGKSSSREIAKWELHRVSKQLQGQYVFPPVKPTHRLQPSDPSKPSHRRFKTMSKIMECGEVSHWSGDSS